MAAIVLHQTSTPPTAWHLVVVGDQDELCEVVEHLEEFHYDHIKNMHLGAGVLMVCLDWIGVEIAHLLKREIETNWPKVAVTRNGRELCQGHT